MKRKIAFSILTLIIIVVITVPIFAGSAEALFSLKVQDYVIVGKIVQKEDIKIILEVSELIQSASKKSKIPKIIPIYGYLEQYQQGDCVAVSIKSNYRAYSIKNGIYKVTTTDTDTLQVIPSFEGQDIQQLYRIEAYLRTRGKITSNQFGFTQDTLLFHQTRENDIAVTNRDILEQIIQNSKKNPKQVVSNSFPIMETILICLVFFIIGTCSITKIRKKEDKNETNKPTRTKRNISK